MNKVTIDKNTEIADFENFLDVYQDDNGFYSFNLNNTLYLNFSEYEEYTCRTYEFWTTISHKIYGTTRLAWLLMKVNDVKAKDILKMKEPNDVIKYPSYENVKTIVNYINNIQ